VIRYYICRVVVANVEGLLTEPAFRFGFIDHGLKQLPQFRATFVDAAAINGFHLLYANAVALPAMALVIEVMQ